jgi:hypothetical protein
MQGNQLRSKPGEYLFSETDRDKWTKRDYRFPCRLVTNGDWATMWRPRGKRGGGAIASVLPVLALSSYPDAPTRERPDLPPPDDAFTPWAYLSCRRIGTLAGVNYDTARRAMHDLAFLGWAELRNISGQHGRGGHEVWYRLSRQFFAGNGEQWRSMSGHLIYSGSWAVLPTSAARHVYMMLMALDPVHNEDKLVAAFDEQHGIGDPEEQELKIAQLRHSKAPSRAQLLSLSGLQRSTLDEALSILLAPLFTKNAIPLVRTGRGNGSRWYSLDSRAPEWRYEPDFLNARGSIDSLRRQLWPMIERRKVRPSKRRKVKKAA